MSVQSTATPLADLRGGVSLDDVRKTGVVSAAAIAAQYAPTLLLVHALDVASAAATEETRSAVAEAERVTIVLYPLRRKPESSFDFIAIGRHEKNDVCIPHASVSRFHAFLRPAADGMVLYDAQSSQGTFCNGQPAPKQGAPSAPIVHSGDALRFGDVAATLVTAADVATLLGKL